MKSRSNPKRYYPPKNFLPVSIYLTPEQHAKAKRRAQEESKALSKQVGRPITISMADYIRTLIERDKA